MPISAELEAARPTKNSKSSIHTATSKTTATACPSLDPPTKPIATHANRSQVIGMIKMTDAVTNWLVAPRYPSTLTSKCNPLSLKQHAATVGTPCPSLKKYRAADKQKRTKLRASVFPKHVHLGKDDVKLIEQCVFRHDRANDPKDGTAWIDVVQDLNTKLSRKQAND